ncbi:MAG: MFS transporter [Planctomycetes bacterium]|nr:MFS transporter [Planctomycetota bacterium]
MTARPRLLERLVLHRAESRAWALYDWANSAMFTVIITAVFPIFFRQVAGEGLDDDSKRRVFSAATTISLLIVALLGPILGAISDTARIKKRLFAVFLVLGVAANAAMFWIGPGDWRLACVLFALVNIGAAGSFVFYDALLVSVAKSDEMDRLSTSAYAIGYLGGGLCLAFCLALIQAPQWFGLDIAPDAGVYEKSLPARIGFLVVAAWWGTFSLPFFKHVREPALVREPDERGKTRPVRFAFTRLAETFRELRTFKHAFVFLLAFFAYNEGIGTVIRMATLLGDERGIDQSVLIQCILLVQFVGVPCSLLYGRLASWIGVKRAILSAVIIYVGIALLAYRLATPGEFLVLALLVGLVQGGAQALSRSLFASLVPHHKAGEFFGLFAALEKFAGIAGPAVFVIAPTTGSAILVIVGFFVAGAALLLAVDVDAGRRAAEAATPKAPAP